MANTFRKIYKKTGNSGSTSDYQLVGNVGVNGVELDIMKGATSGADGEIGLVPKPTAGQQNRILTGNGTFQTVKSILTSESLIKNNLTTTTSGSVLDAYQGKVLNDKIASTNSNISSANTKINSLQSTVNGMLKIGTKTVNCAAGVNTFKETLSKLGLTGKTILSCQCCNSTSSVCKIIGFSVSGGYLYISFDGTNQVGTSQIRIVYC